MSNNASQTQTAGVQSRAQSVGIQFWVLAVIGAVSFAAVGHLLIKDGLLKVGHAAAGHPLSSKLFIYLTNPIVFTGLFIYGVGTLMWVFAVSRKEISFLYPLTALNYGVIALGGKLLFGEVVSPTRWMGIAVVVMGVIFMQKSGDKVSK